ncbi:MAG: FKBP-type peptidyl-prolyl cis-trans isomerase [Maricaulaceae bacterium]|jgi:FKBP-type peptidyl-prolyl cis-trans isomerase
MKRAFAALALAGAMMAAGCGQGGSGDVVIPDEPPEDPIIQRSQARTAEDRLAEAEAYLAENADRGGVVTTDTGLQYQVLAQGPADGPRPAVDQLVCVHYKGTFMDGLEFDSSFSRNSAAAFRPNQVIAGWTEALQLMRPGDKFRLFIHPDLAYGDVLRGSIAPNSMLIFEVELIKFLDEQPGIGEDCSEE